MKTIKEYISTAEGMNQMHEMVNDLLDNFGFSRVETTMEALDWKWACTKEEADEYREEGLLVYYPPSDAEFNGWNKKICEFRPEIPQLRKHARKLIMEALKSIPDGEDSWGSETGGFMVKIYISDEKERNEYYGQEVPDDFEHSVGIALYFVAAESESF